MVRSQSSKITEHHRELHGNNDAYARSNMKFITILHDLAVIGHKLGGAGGTKGYNDFSDVVRSVTSLKRRLALVRKQFPGLLTVGRVELEVVDTDVIINSGRCAKKASVMRFMMDRSSDDGSRKEPMILVHAHVIMFLNGNDLDEVKSYLHQKWPGKNMVRVQPLHDDKSVTKNISNLCSYMVKDRFSYNHSMTTSEYQTGSLFDNGVLSYLVRLCLSVTSKRMAIWSKRRIILDTKPMPSGSLAR